MATKKNKNWSLKRVLSRDVEISGFEPGDLKWAWAAYKRGAFDDHWGFAPDYTPEQFKENVIETMLRRYDAVWSISCQVPGRGMIPVGIATAFFPHKEVINFMVLDEMVWYPWASARNKVEAAAKFGVEVRKQHPVLAFVRYENRDFMAVLGKLGVAQRVGTSNQVFPGERAAVWESR